MSCGEPSGENVLTFGSRGALPAMAVMEFLVGMALCRRGGSTTSQVCRETARLFDARLDQSIGHNALKSIERRGWAQSSEAVFSITESGIEVMETIFLAMVRLLDGGRGLLDVSVLTSIVREFERKA